MNDILYGKRVNVCNLLYYKVAGLDQRVTYPFGYVLDSVEAVQV